MIANNGPCRDCGKELGYHLQRKCPYCEGDRNRAKVDALRDVIRELKAGLEVPIGPDRERELMRDLDTLGHPDKDGFLRWLDEQRAQGKKPQSMRRRA